MVTSLGIVSVCGPGFAEGEWLLAAHSSVLRAASLVPDVQVEHFVVADGCTSDDLPYQVTSSPMVAVAEGPLAGVVGYSACTGFALKAAKERFEWVMVLPYPYLVESSALGEVFAAVDNSDPQQALGWVAGTEAVIDSQERFTQLYGVASPPGYFPAGAVLDAWAGPRYDLPIGQAPLLVRADIVNPDLVIADAVEVDLAYTLSVTETSGGLLLGKVTHVRKSSTQSREVDPLYDPERMQLRKDVINAALSSRSVFQS